LLLLFAQLVSVVVFFKAAGSAPPLKQSKFKFASEGTVRRLLEFLRQQLQFSADEPLVRVCW
jgi:hypothetical protein